MDSTGTARALDARARAQSPHIVRLRVSPRHRYYDELIYLLSPISSTCNRHCARVVIATLLPQNSASSDTRLPKTLLLKCAREAMTTPRTENTNRMLIAYSLVLDKFLFSTKTLQSKISTTLANHPEKRRFTSSSRPRQPISPTYAHSGRPLIN